MPESTKSGMMKRIEVSFSSSLRPSLQIRELKNRDGSSQAKNEKLPIPTFSNETLTFAFALTYAFMTSKILLAVDPSAVEIKVK